MANATKKATAKKAASMSPLDEAVAASQSAKAVTPASEWRSDRAVGMIIELPSGRVARLRRTMNLVKLLKAGKIPNPLAGAVREMIQSQSAAPDLKNMPKEAVEQLMDLVTSQVPLIWVEPVVQREPDDWDEDADGVWQPDDGCISIDDVDYEDRMFAFAFAQGQAADLTSFRAAKAAALAGLVNVEDVELPSESTDESG